MESVRHNDADIAEQVARQAHERLVKGETPADLDAVVEALPSVTETSIDLVEAMATANTEVLVVDLRNNPVEDRSTSTFSRTPCTAGRG